MIAIKETQAPSLQRVKPLCPVFGACGGCAYQDLPYEEELRVKENLLRDLFHSKLGTEDFIFRSIEASPEPYHYRNRLDLTLKRGRRGEFQFGFQPLSGRKIIPIDACAIASQEISEAIPRLREEAIVRLPSHYRTANLVVRSDPSGRLRWGGIGPRSLALPSEDYFWVEIHGVKIFYSLETFFQANLSILSRVMDVLSETNEFTKDTEFFDLYGGVGLFGIYFARRVARVTLIEEHSGSVKIAEYNGRYHELPNFAALEGRTEILFNEIFHATAKDPQKTVLLADPPRKGLGPAAREILAEARNIRSFFYLSCNPVSLVEDLEIFLQKGWKIRQIIPFDFFPKTRHLETLVWLKP